jgi:hypothetical protein
MAATKSNSKVKGARRKAAATKANRRQRQNQRHELWRMVFAYSQRMAVTGSTREARQAGSAAARTTTGKTIAVTST